MRRRNRRKMPPMAPRYLRHPVCFAYPLAKSTVAALKAWLREPQRGHADVLFPNARGGRLSPDGVHYLFVRHCAAASKVCPSLTHKPVTVHVLRHTMALDLLQERVDRSV